MPAFYIWKIGGKPKGGSKKVIWTNCKGNNCRFNGDGQRKAERAFHSIVKSFHDRMREL